MQRATADHIDAHVARMVGGPPEHNGQRLLAERRERQEHLQEIAEPARRRTLVHQMRAPRDHSRTVGQGGACFVDLHDGTSGDLVEQTQQRGFVIAETDVLLGTLGGDADVAHKNGAAREGGEDEALAKPVAPRVAQQNHGRCSSKIRCNTEKHSTRVYGTRVVPKFVQPTLLANFSTQHRYCKNLSSEHKNVTKVKIF